MSKPNSKDESKRILFRSILKLETVTECEQFFRDLCTLEELDNIADRWEVVRQLAQGKSYRQIHDETGISTATITRVAHWLRHGTGGYRKMLGKIKMKS